MSAYLSQTYCLEIELIASDILGNSRPIVTSESNKTFSFWTHRDLSQFCVVFLV